MSASGYFTSAWPYELAYPLTTPRTPLHIHICCFFLQAIILAGSDINASKLKICRRTGCRGCPRPGVCTRGCVAPAPHSDAQWRMQESPTQARRTDVLEAEWVSCWLSAFIPSLSFMQVHVRCHTLPLSVAGDAAYRRGCKTYFVNQRIVSVSHLCETVVGLVARQSRNHHCFHWVTAGRNGIRAGPAVRSCAFY